MDSLALYTIRLAVNQPSKPTVCLASPIPATVFQIKTWPMRPGDTVPKLRRTNLLSLLYHADEQWSDSVRQVSDRSTKTIDNVHRQQMIYLDTLLLLHKAIGANERRSRLQEAVLFAAQVLHHDHHVRCLEPCTQELKPMADKLYLALETLRKVSRAQALQPTRASMLATHLLQTRLDDFIHHWDRFEAALYECYSQQVFGTRQNIGDQSRISVPVQQHALPQELFSDSFTRLLPMTLHRALSHAYITLPMVQDLDPIAFIAVPRLALLSGMLHFSHVSEWRRNDHYSVWFQSQATAMQRLRDEIVALEEETRQQSSHEGYTAFVRDWMALEQALVRGWHTELPASYRRIYLSVCTIADALLANQSARSFTVILRHLFNSFSQDQVNTSQYISESASDKRLGVSERTFKDDNEGLGYLEASFQILGKT
ncbi:hypothetical protein BJV82DRAFT_575903 [Fennellomyces sp. T-0311]|nr:hypothetical protein BJV82DRAFT_575903 [Fennellomyces sp. T-0311]